MNLIKVFETSSMPDDFFGEGRNVFDTIDIVSDGYTPYLVGAFVKEALGKEDYSQEDISICGKLDQWLIDNGASSGEKVLVYHG